MKNTFVFIDMTCTACGGTMNVPENLKSKVIDRRHDGRLEFYDTAESFEPTKIECPYCHKQVMFWKEGTLGAKANGSSVVIHGNVTGANIIIGNNNKFG